jgi:2-polyprenyl-6-methoxyphenol hydroxylase-like FAD-dependent oxidoreductase
MPSTDTDVLVVGAGPTGLTLALALTAHGVACHLVDALPEGANTSRAAVVHARTLEVLEPLGVTDLLLDEGLRTPLFTLRDRDRVLMSVSFDHLPTPYPFTLMISQARTEALLLTRLTEQGAGVDRPRVVTALEQGPDAVTAVFESGPAITARWVVGADGMHSVVRREAGIPFDGAAYPESFLLADVRLRADSVPTQVVLFFSPAGLVVLAPLPGGYHRVVATLDPAPAEPTVDDVQRLLDARGPQREPAVVDQVVWGSRFRVHHRVAAEYRRGRLLLAGDAAHVHSPAGGQGMNTGIQDAVALASALASTIAGDGGALDRYDADRRPVAHRVVRNADRLTRLATMPAARRPLRNTLLRVVGSLPPVRQRLARQLSGIDLR